MTENHWMCIKAWPANGFSCPWPKGAIQTFAVPYKLQVERTTVLPTIIDRATTTRQRPSGLYIPPLL